MKSKKSDSKPIAEAKKDPINDQVKIPVRQQLFGNWTGKVPVNLLHEFIQKEKWEKPNYQFYTKPKGIICKITLKKYIKKTSKFEEITFTSGEYFQDQQLAKHSTATYALHRLCSHKSLHTLLPPSQRDLWHKYEKWKQEKDPDVIPLEYTPDPFLAREQAVSQIEKVVEPWLEYPTIHIPKQQRERLEMLIRSNTEHVIVTEQPEMSIERVQEVLMRKGFRKAHVIESMQYHKNIQAAMDWLCIHVPEDDLPPNMRLTDKKSIVVSKNTTETLSRQFIVDRLIRPGFPRPLCESHLDDCNGDEYWAVMSLCMELAGLEFRYHINPDVEAIEQILVEEKEVVESIYGDQFKMETDHTGFKFSIELEVTGIVELYLPKNANYPQVLPGIVICDSKLPAYIRLSITRKVIQSCLTYLGAPLIFSIISAIEEIAPDVIQSPPPLLSLYAPASGIEFKEIKIKPKKQSQSKSRLKSDTKIAEENKRLFKEYMAKIDSVSYQKMLKIRKKLPSYSYKERIIRLLNDSQALIVCGETGCGKSTQLGQFILEDMLESEKGGHCNIICTQPRRISATSLADRVAAERVDKVGNEIGYSIRGESKQSSNTKLLFCTTGVLLRMIQNDTELSHISHVIIDEVHERGVESDFLLVLLRDLLQRRSDLRVILMSATIEASTVANYFTCPVVEIPGFTHPVQDYYLESILEELDYTPKNLVSKTKKKDAEEVDDEMEELTVGTVSLKKLVQTERDSGFQIDYELIARVVAHICSNGEAGAILIFLPGIMEIKKCIQEIKQFNNSILSELEILPLHSNLTSQEQSQVFKKMMPGKRKVVVSTNIAETSVTIDDVVFVIDTGRVKEMKLINNVLSLVEVWASLAACKQRRGRAGRVQPGKAYKLFTSFFAKKHMRKYTEPEILRLPLEQLCLQIKSMEVENVAAFLSKALTPPPVDNVRFALELLEKVNAIGEDHKLTALGRHIAQLPTDIRIGKMLVFGAIFHCLDPILTIATSVSGKSPFVSPVDRREEAAEQHKQFKVGKSDHLMLCKAFDEWLATGKKGKSAQWAFCEKNYLSMNTLTSMQDLRKQFLDTLIDLGYVSKDKWELLNSNSKDEKIVKAVILAGMYPNVANIKMPKQMYDQTAEGTVAVAVKTQEIRFYTKDDNRVFIHPSSSLFSEKKYQDSVMIYGSKVATSKTFLRECTVVPAIALFLLGGKIQMLHGGRALKIDGINFQAFPRIAALISGMRILMDKTLNEKINYPDTDVIQSEAGQMCMELLQAAD